MLAKLHRRNIQGCGFDISESFVQAARARRLVATVGDARDLDFPEATLLIALGKVLAYCNASGEVALGHLIRSTGDSLLPGGYIVFDLTSPEMKNSASWSEGDDWFVASQSRIVNESHLERRITIFFRDGDAWRRTDEVHHQKLLDSKRVDRLLYECDLIVEHISMLGDIQSLSGRDTDLARKKG